MSELTQDQFETVLDAFGSIRAIYDNAGDIQAVLDEINSKTVGASQELLVMREFGRLMTQDDLLEVRRRKQIRNLYTTIEGYCRTAVQNDNTLAQLKAVIAAEVA